METQHFDQRLKVNKEFLAAVMAYMEGAQAQEHPLLRDYQAEGAPLDKVAALIKDAIQPPVQGQRPDKQQIEATIVLEEAIKTVVFDDLGPPRHQKTWEEFGGREAYLLQRTLAATQQLLKYRRETNPTFNKTSIEFLGRVEKNLATRQGQISRENFLKQAKMPQNHK